MKITRKCEKCNSNDILRIEGEIGVGNNIPTGFTNLNVVLVTRYLCCECGYSEEWIDDKEDIEKLRRIYK